MIRYTPAQLRAAHAAQGATDDQADALAGTDRVPRAKRTGPTPEGTVVREVLAFLKHHPKVAWFHRMNTGVAMLPGRGGVPQPVRFGFAGCSDILGQMTDGRLLAIECKAPGGKCSKPQEEFLRMVHCHNGVALVARSVADLGAIVEVEEGNNV